MSLSGEIVHLLQLPEELLVKVMEDVLLTSLNVQYLCRLCYSCKAFANIINHIQDTYLSKKESTSHDDIWVKWFDLMSQHGMKCTVPRPHFFACFVYDRVKYYVNVDIEHLVLVVEDVIEITTHSQMVLPSTRLMGTFERACDDHLKEFFLRFSQMRHAYLIHGRVMFDLFAMFRSAIVVVKFFKCMIPLGSVNMYLKRVANYQKSLLTFETKNMIVNRMIPREYFQIV